MTRSQLQDELHTLEEQYERYLTLSGNLLHVTTNNSALVNIYGLGGTSHITANDAATVNIHGARADDTERVPLIGSLPSGAALEPGCTDVWTIRLGTGRSPFFIPASYHLQVTVIYGLVPANKLLPDAGPDRRRTFSNAAALTVPLKSALWNVMVGGTTGGLVGSVAKNLQDTGSFSALFGTHVEASVGSLLLAMILSGAAIVFTARKSESQSFVTVEDFWGGLLIGFLIGYSGTAAFTDITGLKKR